MLAAVDVAIVYEPAQHPDDKTRQAAEEAEAVELLRRSGRQRQMERILMVDDGDQEGGEQSATRAGPLR